MNPLDFIASLDGEAKSAALTVFNLMTPHWTEITDDPATLPSHNDNRVIVLREDDVEFFGRSKIYPGQKVRFWQVANVTWESDKEPLSCFTDNDFPEIFPTHWRPI